jgi:hypothetical protein
MSRWKASGIHLLLSAAIVGTVVLVMLVVWYPWPLFKAAGGSQLTFILAAVDVTIGPLITLIIFKTGKKSLRFDLTVIALLQLTALVYGVQTVYRARPIYLVFTHDRFELVMAKDIDPADLAKVKREPFRHLPLGRPRYIAAAEPADPNLRNEVLSAALAGKDLQMFPQYYVEYPELRAQVLAKAQPVELLRKHDAAALDDFLKSHKLAEATVRFLPLTAPKRDCSVLLDAKTAAPIEILLIDPWQE